MPRVNPAAPLEERIEAVFDTWCNPDEVRLRAGEIDPETMRTIQAVLGGVRRAVEAELQRDKVPDASANPLGYAD